MIPTVAACAVFLLVGFAIKHAPSRHPRSIRYHRPDDGRLIKREQDL